MNKFYFGMETMRVTQNYNIGSHYNHTTGEPKDYPIDVAGVDSGQSAYFLPVDMKVTAIRGTGSGVTNTIWLVTTEKVETPTFNDYVWMTLTHWNDGSITSKFKVNQILKAGTIVAYEGKDGANANHLHIVCGRGVADSWLENSKGSWVIKGKSLPPEDVMFIKEDFTNVVDTGGLKFKNMSVVNSFFGSKGYFSLGDNHENIGRIADFMYKVFPSYTDKRALGNYYGQYIMNSIKEFQRRTKLEVDGSVGPITLNELKKYGFKI